MLINPVEDRLLAAIDRAWGNRETWGLDAWLSHCAPPRDEPEGPRRRRIVVPAGAGTGEPA